MILIVGRYAEPNRARASEFYRCLARNCSCAHIKQIYVIRETQDIVIPQHPKIVPFALDSRLTYELAFRFANVEAPDSRVILANADIWFDESLGALDGFDLSGRLLCLSRWEPGPGRSELSPHSNSQDAWIFQTPLREFPCGWALGVCACDNRLAFEANRAGLLVSNPSRTIRANHLHLSGIRRWTYEEQVPGSHLYLPAVHLGNGIPRRCTCVSVAFPNEGTVHWQGCPISMWNDIQAKGTDD